MHKKFSLIFLVLFNFNSFYASAYEMEDVSRIDFEVRDPNSNELFFTGIETISQTLGNIRKETVYYSLDMKAVQFEDVLYAKDNLRVGSYRFKNVLTGEITEADTTDKLLKIRYRQEEGKSYKEGTLKWEENSFHGKVFNNLILRNWTSLLKKIPISFDLVLPYRFESLGFKIVYNGSRTVGKEEREVFLLQPSSLILRAIAPYMEFQYSKGDKPRIQKFLGPCTIPIKGEKDRMVDIIFSYPKA